MLTDRGYEVDPLTCVQCGGTMKIIAFLTDYALVDRIINRLKLRIVAPNPPPPRNAYQEVLGVAAASIEYFSYPSFCSAGEVSVTFGVLGAF
jgi:hypothetical protein